MTGHVKEASEIARETAKQIAAIPVGGGAVMELYPASLGSKLSSSILQKITDLIAIAIEKDRAEMTERLAQTEAALAEEQETVKELEGILRECYERD